MTTADEERIKLFLYIADKVVSCSQLPHDMLHKIEAVRAVRGFVLQEHKQRAENAHAVYTLVAVDKTHPTLPALKRHVDQTAAALLEYQKASALARRWLQEVDPDLYAGAATQAPIIVPCACTRTAEDDKDWVQPKAEQKLKRTRTRET